MGTVLEEACQRQRQEVITRKSGVNKQVLWKMVRKGFDHLAGSEIWVTFSLHFELS